VVLHDVPQRADGLVEPAPALDVELLGHGDLHAVHVAAVPDRLEQRVGEAEHEQVLDRLLAEVVVDPEDAVLREAVGQHRGQLVGGRHVATEGLLDHQPGALVEADLGQPGDHVVEQLGWHSQVHERQRAAVQPLLQLLVHLGRPVVALHVGDLVGQLPPHLLVDLDVLVDQRAVGVVPKLGVVPLGGGHPDHGHVVEAPVGGHVVDGREQLLAGQVTGGPEHHQCVRTRAGHRRTLPVGVRSDPPRPTGDR
jgi:hypothetical protein